MPLPKFLATAPPIASSVTYTCPLTGQAHTRTSDTVDWHDETYDCFFCHCMHVKISFTVNCNCGTIHEVIVHAV